MWSARVALANLAGQTITEFDETCLVDMARHRLDAGLGSTHSDLLMRLSAYAMCATPGCEEVFKIGAAQRWHVAEGNNIHCQAHRRSQ